MSTKPVLNQGTGYGLIIGLGFLFGEKVDEQAVNRVVDHELILETSFWHDLLHIRPETLQQ